MIRPEGATLAITFVYVRDLPRAMAFYQQVMGLTLAIDQGWCKIYRLCEGAHLGLVDETKGMHRWAAEKPVQICLRVRDVDGWHSYLKDCGLASLSDIFANDALGIRAFVFDDPEGYQIEIQTATRAGA